MEEVIEKRENNSRDVVFKNQELGIKKQDASLATWYWLLDTKETTDWNNKKTYHAEQKAARVEESKKGYTGDALALRGDERRDKLR